MTRVTVVGMIYKSLSYLNFMMEGLRKYTCSFGDFEVNYLIVANDASSVIIDSMENNGICHIKYNDPSPADYYINRIYRAWNFGGRKADGDIIVFINSDMAFSPCCLENLLRRLNKNTIPCSRLVESGKLLSGTHAISRDFGKAPESFNESGFLEYAKQIGKSSIEHGGLFMPCAFYKRDFVNSGGYPEGNIYKGGVGVVGSKFSQSGDDYFFNVNSVMKNKEHITVFDSVVYHIQEGEKDV